MYTYYIYVCNTKAIAQRMEVGVGKMKPNFVKNFALFEEQLKC